MVRGWYEVSGVVKGGLTLWWAGRNVSKQDVLHCGSRVWRRGEGGGGEGRCESGGRGASGVGAFNQLETNFKLNQIKLLEFKFLKSQ